MKNSKNELSRFADKIRKSANRFTLIELLVVIAIITILPVQNF